MPFNDTPTGGDDWKPKDHIGELLVCEYYEHVRDMQTKFGVMDAVRVLVSPVEGEHVGETIDTIFFNKPLVSAGRSCIGKGHFLGRLAKVAFANGTGIAMEPPTDADKEKAARYEKWMADKGTPLTAAKPEPRPQQDNPLRTVNREEEQEEEAPPAPKKSTAKKASAGTYTDDEPPF